MSICRYLHIFRNAMTAGVIAPDTRRLLKQPAQRRNGGNQRPNDFGPIDDYPDRSAGHHHDQHHRRHTEADASAAE